MTAEVRPSPWILGHRGSPLEAPENTLASFRRALELGLHGVSYDARACASGEIVLWSDETLDRTSDGAGPLAERNVVELSRLDAGGWFGARFKGEPVALLDDALDLSGPAEAGSDARPVHHVVVLRERGLVREVARVLAHAPPGMVARVASASLDECVEARDAGVSCLWMLDRAGERERSKAREARIQAVAAPLAAWRTESGRLDWDCERWSLCVDDPDDLLEACRLPLAGFTTTEPLRALAAHELARLAPEDEGPWPVRAPDLVVRPGDVTGGRGDWCGSWTASARVRNPFPFPIQVTAGILPRHGAFEIGGLPRRFALSVGEEREVAFSLTGGSWRPGGDPLFFALARWRKRAGTQAGSLLLDAPLRRIRVAVADGLARRLTMLRESPGDRAASMVARRQGRHLLVSIENAAGLESPRTIVHLAGRSYFGGRGVRVLLPEGFDTRPSGASFSCGFVAGKGSARVVRRFSGGVPDEIGCGAPGRILPSSEA